MTDGQPIRLGLDISDRIVEGHLANFYEKLHVNSRTQAATHLPNQGGYTIE